VIDVLLLTCQFSRAVPPFCMSWRVVKPVLNETGTISTVVITKLCPEGTVNVPPLAPLGAMLIGVVVTFGDTSLCNSMMWEAVLETS
jgi:hypothetical protein